MAVEQFANYVKTTLSGSMTNVATSLTVASATGFPAAAPYRVRVEDATNGDELLLVTAGAGTTTWTVTRGVEGTTAVAHASGLNVHHVLTAGGLAQRRADGVQSGPSASRPAAGNAGTLYLPSDGVGISRDSGSDWGRWGPAAPLTAAPAAAGWTRLDATAATLTDIDGGVSLAAANVNGFAVAYVSAPTAPYTLDVAVAPFLWPGSTPWAGPCWVDPSAKKIAITAWQYDSGYTQGAVKFALSKYTVNPDLWSSDYAVAAATTYRGLGGLIWWRYTDDGTTNRAVYLSNDGQTWYRIQQVGRTDYVNPTAVGIAVSAGSTSGAAILNLLHWHAH